MYLVPTKFSQLFGEGSVMDIQPREGLFRLPFKYKYGVVSH